MFIKLHPDFLACPQSLGFNLSNEIWLGLIIIFLVICIGDKFHFNSEVCKRASALSLRRDANYFIDFISKESNYLYSKHR